MNDTYLALLRGINVGGKKSVSMFELKVCFEKLGFENVKTFGNSGNIIFQTDLKDARDIEIKIEKALDKYFFKGISVFVRSLEEMKKIVSEIPPKWHEDKTKKYDIMFLHSEIDNPKIIKELKPNPDLEELYYHPGVLFWSINTNEFGKSYVPKIVGSKIYKEITIRTASVVKKLFELMSTL